MTCCVALRIKHKNNKISLVIGSDSASCEDNEVMSTVDPKAFTIGEYTMAFAGSFRVGQVLKYHFKPPEPPKNNEEMNRFMVTGFVSHLTDAMKKGGLWHKDDGLKLDDAEFIVSVRGRVFFVGTDLTILEMQDNMVSIGIGKEYALGSLYTSKGLSPEDRVETALEAAAKFSPWVRPPFTIIKCS